MKSEDDTMPHSIGDQIIRALSTVIVRRITATVRTCPRCNHTGPVDSDFGFRTMNGTEKPQSWCRKCRAVPQHTRRRH